MALITMPTTGIRSIQWTQPEWAGFVVRNQWTGGQQVADLGNVRAGWKAKITLADQKIATLLPWRVFSGLAKGPVNTFRVKAVEAGQYSGTLTPTIAVVSQSAPNQILVSAVDANVYGVVLRAGQLITVPLPSGSEQLGVLAADLVINGPGTLAYQGYAMIIEPFREAPTGNAIVETRSPWGLMRMTTTVGGWSVQPGQIYSPFAFDCEEAF